MLSVKISCKINDIEGIIKLANSIIIISLLTGILYYKEKQASYYDTNQQCFFPSKM